MTCVLAVFSTHTFRRFVTLFMIGFCLALWPLAGYAATLFVNSPTDDVNVPTQAEFVVTKSASTAQASIGDTITYTYRITNSGTLTLTILSAIDDQLGAVDGLTGELAPATTNSAILTYVVQLSDVGAPLVNVINVTGIDGSGNNIAGSASATVAILDPTALPESEQPDQPFIEIFLPSIRP